MAVAPLRLLHALGVLCIAAAVVVPTLPSAVFGPVPGWVAGVLRRVSIQQHWAMYTPNPPRSLTYMELHAIYHDGREIPLEENAELVDGWGTTWAWRKDRVDLWRYYANHNPTHRNEHRIWYLRGVCVREARKGDIPKQITMYLVRRRFTPPHKVLRGAPDLGAPDRRFITVQYCEAATEAAMIAEDRERYPVGP